MQTQTRSHILRLWVRSYAHTLRPVASLDWQSLEQLLGEEGHEGTERSDEGVRDEVQYLTHSFPMLCVFRLEHQLATFLQKERKVSHVGLVHAGRSGVVFTEHFIHG